MTLFTDLKQVLVLIYMIPSLALYFLIIYIIFFSPKKQLFSSSFYWIFGFSVINYVVHAITYYAIYRFTVIPMLSSFLATWPEESIWYSIVYTIMYYTAGAIHTYSLALSFNRLTVFILKTKFTIFWNRYLKYFLTFCVLGPVFFVWNFPFIGIKNKPVLGLVVSIAPTITDFAPWMLRSRNLLIEITVTSSLTFVFDLYVLYNIVKWKYMSINEASMSYVSSQDSMMLVYSMLIFLTEAFSCGQQLILMIDRDTFLGFVKSTQFILADVSALAPAWFILATNKQLRHEIGNIIFQRRNRQVSIVATSSTRPL